MTELKFVETMCLGNTQNLPQPLQKDWVEQDFQSCPLYIFRSSSRICCMSYVVRVRKVDKLD